MSKAQKFLDSVSEQQDSDSFDKLASAWDAFTKLANSMIKKLPKEKQKEASSLLSAAEEKTTKLYDLL